MVTQTVKRAEDALLLSGRVPAGVASTHNEKSARHIKMMEETPVAVCAVNSPCQFMSREVAFETMSEPGHSLEN